MTRAPPFAAERQADPQLLDDGSGSAARGWPATGRHDLVLATVEKRPLERKLETVTGVRAFVVEAELALPHEFDPAAVGAAVTVELCGHWAHDGPCRWPHNSAIDAQREPARFRTLFVADDAEAGVVRGRIESVLRSGAEWRLLSIAPRGVTEVERPLAAKLLAGPRLPVS